MTKENANEFYRGGQAFYYLALLLILLVDKKPSVVRGVYFFGGDWTIPGPL